MARRLSVVLLCLLMAACATPAPPALDAVGFERQGRFAMRVQSPDEQAKAVQGNFRWQQTRTGWVLSLNSPLGATLAQLTVDGSGAVLRTPDAPDQRAASATALLQQAIGEPVPIDALEDWIQGRLGRATGIAEVTRDSVGRVTGFTQANWQVTFERYDSKGPTRMTLSSQHQQRDVVLRLAVNQPTP
ncbi:MAG: lipoprotein insertase outer membrane protein LolB [Orrella sp.]